MPAKDLFHDIVKNALIQEGWQITHDPFPVRFGFVDMYIDLGAEKLIAAEKGQEKTKDGQSSKISTNNSKFINEIQ